MPDRPKVYLDHAASTPMRPAAADAMHAVMRDASLSANPASSHFAGKLARRKLEEARESVAAHFAVDLQCVVFNSGGSEGDTHALVGAAALLGQQAKVVISAIEHEAVQEAANLLESLGHEVVRVPVTGQGVVELAALAKEVEPGGPAVVSVMAVNNETGVVQPVSEIAMMCVRDDVIFHCDAVRAAGHGLNEILTDKGIDLINCTGHKFGGPRGVGVLVQRRHKLPQLVCGGGQEGGSRAGTENIAGAVGLATALELATAVEDMRVEELRQWLEHQLVDTFPGCEIHGKRARRATGIVSVSFAPKSGYKLQDALNQMGIAVGTGSACHDGGEVTVSPVLSAMGVEEMLARGTLRISLGWNTTREDLDTLLSALIQLINGPDSEGLNCEI